MAHVVVYPDSAAVAYSTAARLLTALTDILATRDHAHVVLTGGTVGISTLRQISESPMRDYVDWTAVHLWWGDERFVPTGDPDRNEGQAEDALIADLRIPSDNVHRMGASDVYASAEEAAGAYRAELAALGNPAFDIVLLGMGPDGHVASLFPGHPVFGKENVIASAVHDSPKPPPTRVTLGLDVINAAEQVWLIAAGAEKAEAVAKALAGDTSIPAACVHGTAQTLWLVDVTAASSAAV